MKACIQRHDHSAEDFELADATDAKKVLHDFDWAAEWRQFRKDASNSKNGEPGFELVVEDGHVLQIFPDPEGTNYVQFHVPAKMRFLGLYRVKPAGQYTWVNLSLADVDRMIELLFTGDYQGLAKMNPHARID